MPTFIEIDPDTGYKPYSLQKRQALIQALIDDPRILQIDVETCVYNLRYRVWLKGNDQQAALAYVETMLSAIRDD